MTGGRVTNTIGYLGYGAGSSGTATVSSGTWAIAKNLTVDASFRGTGTLTMTGGLVTVGGTLSRGTFGTINLNAGGTLQIGTGGTTGVLGVSTLTNNGTLVFSRSDTSTYAGSISGSGLLTKLGAGMLTLSGSSSFTGGTKVLAGTLRAGDTSSFGTGTIVLSSGATLDLADLTLSNAIVNQGGTIVNGAGYLGTQQVTSGTATITGTSAGTAVLTGSSNFTGGTTISSGVVAVQNTKALGNGGVTVSSGGKLLVDGIELDLGGAAVALGFGAELETTSGARVTISGSSDLSGVRTAAPGSTSAAILAGTAISGTLATTWTTTADAAVKSAVLELKTPTTAANPFVLSLTYAAGLDASGLFLGWNDPVSGDWVNAVVGNELVPGMTGASGSQLGYLGSFAAFQSFYGTNLSSYLGAYGRDGTGHTVWAVINHNSEFAVTEITPVPEPGTWALALAGLAGVGVSLRRKASRHR